MIETILNALLARPRPDGRGLVILVSAAQSRMGASYAARQLGLQAAAQLGQTGQRAMLVDYDLSQQSQSQHFFSQGHCSGPYDAMFGAQAFWQVSPDLIDENGHRSETECCATYIHGQSGLAFSAFDWSRLREGQSVHLRDAGGYWEALRDQFAVTIIDAPARERSDAVSALYAHADSTVLVCAPGAEASPEILAQANAVGHAGGSFAGLIINDNPTAQTGWGAA